MQHTNIAADNFKKGYNCAQSVFLAFSDITNFKTETALRLSSSFGGGMGGLKEVCGVLSGAFMVLGLKYGMSENGSPEDKKEFYALIKSFGDKFNEKFGSLLCRNLEEQAKTEGFLKAKPDNDFYQKKPCALYVEYAAALLDEYLK